MINISSHIYFKIAVACVSSCIFFIACENNVNEVKALGSKAGGIDVGKDVAIYISNDGKVSAKLMAPLMNKYLLDSGKMIEFPATLKVDFYKDSLVVESKLTANYANYIEAENKVFLRDGRKKCIGTKIPIPSIRTRMLLSNNTTPLQKFMVRDLKPTKI
jgi:superfamily I DNA and/or RNA helicase